MFQKLNQIRQFNVVKVLNLQKFKRHAIFTLGIVAVLIANVLLSPLTLRLDFSKGKAYTLSSSTKKIINELDKPVNVTFYVSDIPTKFIPLKTDVTDLLKEYEKAGKNINVQFKDPKKDAKALQEVQQAGIPELQFSQVEQDNYVASTGYLALIIGYGDQQEVIPQVSDVGSLEYNVTSSIFRLTRPNLPVIGVLGYPQTLDIQANPIGFMDRILGQQFKVEYIDVSTASAATQIDKKYNAVLVFDTNQKTYDDQELNALKTYLNNKGKAVFFVDGVWVQDGSVALPQNHNLSGLLKDYGITLENNLVLSTAAELVEFGNDVVLFQLPYPFWLKTNVFTPNSSYISNVQQLTYPWVSALTLQKKSGFEIKEIVKTINQSWEQRDPFILNPEQIPQPEQKDLKQFIIAAESKKQNGGHIVVIPSARFVVNQYLSQTSNNLDFVLNVLNELANGGALSGIRQRSVSIYPLPNDLTPIQKELFKYLNILLLPTVFALYGAVRIIRRK